MYFARILIATSLIAAAVIPSLADAAGSSNLRSTPIVARPSRPGHFYGNTVRRVHQRRNG
jgi:hypothetical protein